MRGSLAGSLLVVALGGAPASASAQEEEPTKWEQLFFPFPIVGAPPQLEQQVQVFDSYFRGKASSGDVPAVELAYIASPHLGLVATVPRLLRRPLRVRRAALLPSPHLRGQRHDPATRRAW